MRGVQASALTLAIGDALIGAVMTAPEPLRIGDSFEVGVRRDVAGSRLTFVTTARLPSDTKWHERDLDAPYFEAAVARRMGVKLGEGARLVHAWLRSALTRAHAAPDRSASLGAVGRLRIEEMPTHTGRNPRTGAPVFVAPRALVFLEVSRRTRALLAGSAPPPLWDASTEELLAAPAPPPAPLPHAFDWPAEVVPWLAALRMPPGWLTWTDRAQVVDEADGWLDGGPSWTRGVPFACIRENRHLVAVLLLEDGWQRADEARVRALGLSAFEPVPWASFAAALSRLSAWDAAAGPSMLSPDAADRAADITSDWDVPLTLRRPLPF